MTPLPGPAASPADTSVVVTSRCAGCGACLLTCPTHAIRPCGGTLLVAGELCTGCLECIEVCPVDAIDETNQRSPVTAAPAAPSGGAP